jgi:hypothetical protein
VRSWRFEEKQGLTGMCRRYRATLTPDQLGTASGLETLTGNAAINTSETVPTVARRV